MLSLEIKNKTFLIDELKKIDKKKEGAFSLLKASTNSKLDYLTNDG